MTQEQLRPHEARYGDSTTIVLSNDALTREERVVVVVQFMFAGEDTEACAASVEALLAQFHQAGASASVTQVRREYVRPWSPATATQPGDDALSKRLLATLREVRGEAAGEEPPTTDLFGATVPPPPKAKRGGKR